MSKKAVLAIAAVVAIASLTAYLLFTKPKTLERGREAALAERFGFVQAGFLEEKNWENWFAPHLDVGFGWDRPHPGPFVWNDIEPQKGVYDFSNADAYVAAAQERGIKVLATIWPYAEWDQEHWMSQPDWKPAYGFEEELPTSRYKPHDMEAYREFVKRLVERYDGDGVDDMPGLKQPIKYWEVLNEPETSLHGEHCFFRGSPEDYLEILKATYEAIEEADPEAKVLNGGMCPFSKSDNRYLQEFWARVFELGGGQYIDIVNIHAFDPYEGAIEVKKFLSSYGVDKPIWVTEFVVLSNYKDPYTGEYLDEKMQAIEIVERCVKAFSVGVEKVFYVAYVDSPEGPPDLQRGGLIDRYGNPKPAYYAMKTMLKHIGSFVSVERISETCYRFVVDNREVYVLWGCDLPHVEKKAIFDICGKEISEEEAKISSTPVYVCSE